MRIWYTKGLQGRELDLLWAATATATELTLDRQAGNEQKTVEKVEFHNKHLYLGGFSGRVVPPATATATSLPLNCQAGNEEKGEESCQSPEKYQFLDSYKGWTAI